jgi:hypothetical protein
MLLWYVGWVTHQMSQSASAVSRALHIVDDHLKELERKVESQRIADADVVEFPSSVGPGVWWEGPALAALAKTPGRVLHAACGDGWLVTRIAESGVDAYGIDPRTPIVDAVELGVLDVRSETILDHLRAVAAAGLGGIVLSGTVEGMAGGERNQLLAAIASTLTPGGTLVIHSVERRIWDAPDAPYGADLAAGRPLRAATWCRLLEESGYSASAQEGPDGADYLVTAVRGGLTPFDPTNSAPPAR